MSLNYKIQKGVSEFSDLLGTGLKYGGFAALLGMTIIGTVAVDLVILAAMSKQNHRHHHCPPFYISLRVNQYSYESFRDFNSVCLYSMLTTSLAVALAVVLEVPMVAAGLILGWTLVGGLYLVGELLTQLSAYMKPEELDYAKPFPSSPNYLARFCAFFRSERPAQSNEMSVQSEVALRTQVETSLTPSIQKGTPLDTSLTQVGTPFSLQSP